MRVRLTLLALCIVLVSSIADHAQPGVIARLPSASRAEVVARARKLANHSWTCGSSNLRATCSRRYLSDWKAGQQITGIPYRWGGVDSPEEFDRKLAQGQAAGSHSRYGILSCAAGIDCSGFVAYCWGLSGHAYSTSNLRTIAGKPKYNWFTDMKPGDVLNKAGSHVVLFTGYNADGTINVCEASGSKSRVVCSRTTWSRFKGYIPLQYKAIDD